MVNNQPFKLVPGVNCACLSSAARTVFCTRSSAASRSRHMKRAKARKSGSSATMSSFIIFYLGRHPVCGRGRIALQPHAEAGVDSDTTLTGHIYREGFCHELG